MPDDFDPDAYLASSKTTEFDPDAYLGEKKPSPTLKESALDVAKQAPSALAMIPELAVTGPAQLMGLAGRGLKAIGLGGDPEREAEQQKIRELAAEQGGSKGIAQYLPEPKTPAGRYTRTGLEFAGLAAGSPGRLIPNVATGLAGGLASEAGGQYAEGTKYEPLARIGSAILGTGAAGAAARMRFTKAHAGAPLAEELEQSVNDRYGAARSLGVELKPSATAQGLESIREKAGIDEIVAPRTNAMLEKTINSLKETEKPVGFDTVETLRRQVGKLRADPIEKEAVKDVQRGIDDFIAGLKPEHALSGDVAQLSAMGKVAREEAAANFRMRAIEAVRQRAELKAEKGMDAERAYRNELSAFITPNRKGISPALKEGFTKQEVAELRKATRLSKFPHLLRVVGVMGGNHALGAVGVAGAAAGALSGDPRYAEYGAIAMGTGYGARKIAGALMRARADRAARMVASRSPLAKEMGVSQTPPPSAAPWGPSMLNLARPGLYPSVQGPEGFKKGGRVTRTFRVRV